MNILCQGSQIECKVEENCLLEDIIIYIMYREGYGTGYLKPLSTICHLCRGGQFFTGENRCI